MINRGVILKSVREVWLIALLCGAALMAVEALFAIVLPTLQEQLTGILAQMKFFQSILKALLGADVGEGLGSEGIQAFAWVHPVVLALVWAHGIIVCTRVPAGEVDRGTADVLFGLPVSRWNVYRSESVVWLASALVLLIMALIGNRIGIQFAPKQYRIDMFALALVLVNLFCLGLAVGGIACLMSAMSDRRGKAMAAVFAIVVASFLLNFLAQFWTPASKISFLGVLNYYRPVEILRTHAAPIRAIVTLLLLGISAWTAGGIVLARRDIATV